MTEYYTEIKPKNWLELKDWYWALGAGNDWVFRGQKDETWAISSSLERVIPTWLEKGPKKHKREIGDFLIQSEERLFNKFLERVEQFISTGEAAADSLLGKLALMQHHGVPTRLTDWTESPYVATFFAVEEASTAGTCCAVWAISSLWCQDKSAESVRKGMKLTKEQFPDWADFSVDDIFLDNVLRGNIPMIAPLRPIKLNTRIASQQGLFLCPGKLSLSFVENLQALGKEELPQVLYKFIIPVEWRNEIFHDLFNMNIGPHTLFPGLDGFAKSIKLRMNWENDSLDYIDEVRESALRDFGITYYAPNEE
jgi:hypothetical protein